MSHSKSSYPTLLQFMISSKDTLAFFRDLGDHTLQLYFNAWLAWMNVRSKRRIAWSYSGHASWWGFDLHCGMEEAGSPWIICIICYQVLRHPSEHETRWMRKHLLARALVTKVKKLTESDVCESPSSKVVEIAFKILKRYGCWGITIVSLQRKFIFDIQHIEYWSKWQTKCSKMPGKHYDTSRLHKATWNRYLRLGFVSLHIPWNSWTESL